MQYKVKILDITHEEVIQRILKFKDVNLLTLVLQFK
jgi:hypothetical protein